jgi:transcriptional regulator with XRE-family HTH domain
MSCGEGTLDPEATRRDDRVEVKMTDLSRWLQTELRERGLSQNAAAVHAGVAQATLSDMLNKGHVPKVETLFRLADYFETPREQVLRLAGHLPPVSQDPSVSLDDGLSDEDEELVRTLLEEFRRVPDEWKAVAVEQVAQFRHLAELRPVRMVGEEAGDETEE